MIRAACISLVLATLSSAQSPGYKIVQTIKVGGTGGWDYAYADAGSRKLFLAHGTEVTVVDMDSGSVAGHIGDTPGVHGTVVSKSGKGFITVGNGNRVDIFDVNSLKKTGSVNTGEKPDAIAYDPSTDRVFAFDGKSKEATVISAADDKLVANVPLGGAPEAGAADGKGHVFVNVEDTSEIAEIDSKNPKLLRHVKIEGCEGPSGLSIDAAHGRLYSGCHNQVMAVIDTRTLKTLTTLPIGRGVDACAFDPGTGLAFASTGDGHVTIVKETSPGKFEVVQNFETKQGARTMALDTRTHKAYLPTADFGAAPAATAENPRPRPSITPGSFMVVVIGQ